MNEQAKSLSELMKQARTALHMQRDSEELARRGETQAKREEFTRAWAAVFEACAKLLPGPLQPFLRGFPEFKPDEAWNDLPGGRAHFELEVKGLAPITVWFCSAKIIPEGTRWFLDTDGTFRVRLYEKNIDYLGEPEVATCRATANFGGLLLALARAEESEQERSLLESEVELQRLERKARQEQREQQPVIQENPLLAEAQNLQMALRRFLNDYVELQE